MPRVLVVDDEEHIRRQISRSRILRLKAKEARGGPEGMCLMRKSPVMMTGPADELLRAFPLERER